MMKAGLGGEPRLAPSMGFFPSPGTWWASPVGVSVDDGLQLMGGCCEHLSLVWASPGADPEMNTWVTVTDLGVIAGSPRGRGE